jgi:hypothetical protein
LAAVIPPIVDTTVAACVPVTSPANTPVKDADEPLTFPVTLPVPSNRDATNAHSPTRAAVAVGREHHAGRSGTAIERGAFEIGPYRFARAIRGQGLSRRGRCAWRGFIRDDAVDLGV